MVESLPLNPCDMKNQKAILEKIKKELKGKTYLLVLDDVWDGGFNWEDLRASLLGINENIQCSILVTTRSDNIALVRETPPEHRHHLKILGDDECWTIIKERAFGKSPVSPNLERIGRSIARKCADAKRDKYGCITTCKMHDLVHDLAQSISKADIGVKLWHSLFLKTYDFHIVESSRGLRVLNFCGAKIDFLPEEIGSRKTLRYLDISGTAIRRLPETITRLYLLQTLSLLWCNNLKELPNGMKNLVSLRHLHIMEASHVPGEIGCLTSLQTLPIFDVDPERSRGIGELGCLSELRGKLKIFNLQNVRNKEESRGAKLWEKKKLDKLGYTWSPGREDCSNDEETNGVSGPSASLHSPGPTNLVELKLSGCENLKNLPTALGQYPKLKFLEIEGLKNVRCIGKEFYGDGKYWCDSGDDENKAIPLLFPVLEKFRLEHMEELEEWLVEVEPTIPVFPSLKELKIAGCKKLSRVPMMMSRFFSPEILYSKSCNELSWTEEEDGVFPSTLKVLIIQKCPNIRCIPSIEGGDISSLQELNVKKCEKLSKIGEGLLAFSTCLREIYGR
ncbi:hypothetical protein REPUB_Repub20aG0012500 [Reevesia pubescens]